jgi:hypothetical protein
MDKARKPIITQYYTPLSKPFRIYLVFLYLYICATVMAFMFNAKQVVPLINTMDTLDFTPYACISLLIRQ